MKINNLTTIVLVIIITLFACKKNSDSNQQPTITPVATAVGTPDGTSVSQVIGSGGGTITSSDGTMEISIPSGALSANTNVSIQPITNNTPNGRGKAYRCLPDGTQFAKNITIKFHYTAEDLALTKSEYMLVAFQNAEHYWQVVDNVSNDVANKTISVSVNHFTDFSAFDAMRIDPAELYLKPGESANLKVTATGMSQLNTVLLIGQILESPETWKVNGVTGGNSASGTINPSANQTFATYTAPSIVPANNPVAISAEIDFPFVVNGQRFNKGILTAKAFIGGSKYHVLVEIAYNITLGTFDKWRISDKVSFDIKPTGFSVTLQNFQNSDATFSLVTPGNLGCTASITTPGTGGLNPRPQDITSFATPGNSPQISLSSTGLPAITQPIFHISCQGNTPRDVEVQIAGHDLGNITFDDDGKPHVIEEKEPTIDYVKRVTITPVQ